MYPKMCLAVGFCSYSAPSAPNWIRGGTRGREATGRQWKGRRSGEGEGGKERGREVGG